MEDTAQSQVVGLRSLPRRQIIITFAGVMLAMFLASLDQTVVGTAMPRIIIDLGGFSHYTWLTTAYLVASTVAIPITGKLIDMYGRKYLYIAGVATFMLSSLMCGLSNTLMQVIIWRGIQGVGAGIMMANAFTVIGDLFPPAERGKYQGLLSANFGLSSIIGPVLGGFITDTLSWHWVFFVNIPLAAFIIVMFAFFFPHLQPGGPQQHVDYAGAVTLILTVVPAMLALSWAGVDYPWLSVQIIGTFVFSAAMGILFVLIEQRSIEPIIPLTLFRNRIVAATEVVIFITGFAMFGGIIFIPLFFQGVLGLSATTSGSFLTPMMLGMVLGSFLSGQTLSRAGGHYKIQGAIGLALMAIGIGLLSRMSVDTNYTMAVINMVLTGFGLGITMPAYIIAIQNAVPYEILGVATSSAAFFRSIGGAVGLAVLGSVMNNRFAPEFIKGLPPEAKAIIPPQQLDFLVHNPQVLVSPEAQAQLKGAMAQLGPQGATLLQQIMPALRHALDSALSQVFFIGFLVLLLAFIANFFIKEIPLRKQHTRSNPPATEG